MLHQIHRVVAFDLVRDFTIRVTFEDGTKQVVDLRPVLSGEIYGPLADPRLFRQVQIDPDVHTLVWPNGADFDPAVLYSWPQVRDEFARLAQSWSATHV